MPRVVRFRSRAVQRAQQRAKPPSHPSRHVRRVCRQSRPSVPVVAPVATHANEPLYASVYALLRAHLPAGRYSKPAAKRLALLVSGLVAGDTCGVGDLTRTIEGLDVTPAKPESIGRRLRRLLEDARLDPTHVLPDLLVTMLPVLLATLVAQHTACVEQGATQHRHWGPRLRLVVDETSQADHVHIVTVGLAYRGVVLPLLVRTWTQNAPLPDGEYWAQLQGLLLQVYALLPPCLRDHVVVVADRAYGVPRLLDLLASLGWHWLLRVQGQTTVLLREGTAVALRTLVPRPGATWFGRFDPPQTRRPALAALVPASLEAPDASVPLAGVFKAAGWRASQVVGVWAVGAADPWLLVTSLAPTRDRLREYADRWQIERLFLSWKSHGWDLEATGVRDPVRLGRLLTGVVLATQWRLAAGVVEATLQLADLATRARHRPPAPRDLPQDTLPQQLPLPLGAARTPPSAPPAAGPGSGAIPTATTPPPAGASRPAAAKLSLLFQGWQACRRLAGAWQTPLVQWALPDWDAPTWSRQAHQVYAGLTP
jgi:hypothetical protein